MTKTEKIPLAKAVASWLMVLWICRVFLTSLPYKFGGHPDTLHIFGTIGAWMGDVFGAWLGGFFTAYGAYLVGSFELLTSLVLLSPAAVFAVAMLGKTTREAARQLRVKWHAIGGLMASAVMAGAVFFHLFTPLGIVVLHQGEPDGGSLFFAAVSIFVFGLLLFALNRDGLRAAR